MKVLELEVLRRSEHAQGKEFAEMCAGAWLTAGARMCDELSRDIT